ncbi:phage major capsid protein [Janthinobacterium fluminis]|uniref:Phage major capsid protein n=1 Tax=Janthinobacterium fluminis TaxID=2987524 RepID=A0ABT5JUK5_9BURK|nr:phage major capsid protein [Janthinobacterium fluminis]MDC8756254.1 phage major capsid protein [Janthinobacterium fluminis]
MKKKIIGTTLAATMALHFAAFQAKAADLQFYEQRDDPSIKSVADAIDKIATAFEEYKQTNDQRIEAIKAGKSTEALEAKLARMDEHIEAITDAKSRLEKMETKLARPGAFGGGDREKRESDESLAYKSAFFDWIRAPKDPGCEQRLSQTFKALESKAAADSRESRSAQVVVGTNAAGGYALPKVIESAIARLAIDVSPIRQIATVRTVGTTDYHELFDINGAGFEWLGEGDTRNQTNTADLAEIVPTFGMASAKPQASEESLDDLFFNVEDWLIMSAGESMAGGEGAAFISGNGVKKPTGILSGPTPVATADNSRAFGTLQYFASGQASALPSSQDTFLDMVYGVRARYRTNAQWLTAKAVLAALRKYKDNDGQYLWQPALTAGQPATFLGYGITEAEDMPAVAANSFPLAFGDFKEGYLICDRVGMRITRDEITTPGFVKFYVRRRVGGKLRNTQAIKLLKITAA